MSLLSVSFQPLCIVVFPQLLQFKTDLTSQPRNNSGCSGFCADAVGAVVDTEQVGTLPRTASRGSRLLICKGQAGGGGVQVEVAQCPPLSLKY